MAALGAIVGFEIVLLLGERGGDGLNEVQATRRHPAHRDDGVALGIIVGHGEDFAVGAEAVRGAFNNLIGGLAGARIKNFHLIRGFDGGEAAIGIGAVKHDGDRRADGVVVKGEVMDKFIPRGGGMAGLARRKFGPAVE